MRTSGTLINNILSIMENGIWYIPHTIRTLLSPNIPTLLAVENILAELERENKVDVDKTLPYPMYRLKAY